MAKYRELSMIPLGTHTASVSWQPAKLNASDPLLERWAESVPVKVEDMWVYIYLADGQEVVKLSRKRNHSAQVYVGKTIEQVLTEKIKNQVENSTHCCYFRFGNTPREGDEHPRKPCKVHTAKWLAKAVAARMSSLVLEAA